MPHVNRNGVNVYYESLGKGAPALEFSIHGRPTATSGPVNSPFLRKPIAA